MQPAATNPHPPDAPLFTAAEIATALGKNRSNVARLLAGVPASGVKIVSGNEARAWRVADLPSTLRAGLETLTRKMGCQSPEIALRQCCEPWKPPVALAECDSSVVECARLLREAMRQPLLRQHAPGLTAAEREVRGIEDYQEVFGRVITPRHWRDLFARTLRRAGSTPNFDALEIYLPERIKRKDAGQAAQATRTANETEDRLRDFIAAFADVSNPTVRERESLWTQAMEETQSLMDAGESFNRACRIVRAALRKFAPFLAASPEALQKAFARKLAAWQATGGAAQSMADGRRNNTGNHDGFELPDEDALLIEHFASQRYHGHIAAAWRDVYSHDLLSPATIQHYQLSPNKSHVPGKVREAIGSRVEIYMKMKVATRAADMLDPHLSTTRERLFSCQVIQGDDFTMPLYYYIPDGRGWFTLTRGQVLLFNDFRTNRILVWATIPEKQYSSLNIWTSLKRAFLENGIPELLYFEAGVWKNSAILTGKKNTLGSAAEVVQGLREFGIQFTHAKSPRAKPIEKIGGMAQDLMEGEPGYCGRDERRDLPAHTKEILQRVRSRKVHPSTCLYSFEQWNARLGEIIAQYNSTPQQSMHIKDLSPDQAFVKFENTANPPVRLTPDLGFLLSHHEVKEVTANGIAFQIGNKQFRYYGPEFAQHVGRRVLAGFDPEMPEYLTVSDLNGRHPFFVPLANQVDAMACLTGGEENLKHELQRAAGQMAHLRARYNVVKNLIPMRRPVVASQETQETAAKMSRLRKRADQREQATQRTVRAARKAGVFVPHAQRARETTPDELRELNDYLSLPNGEEASES